MNQKIHAATVPSEPRRPLRTDFTAYTIRHAVTAKRRVANKQQIKTFFKEPFSMKSLTFLRTAPGAVLAIAIIATTSAGAYALANWFNADVTVKQSSSVLSVDLSDCKGNPPPGIEPSANRHDIKFKILGSQHISATDLRQRLLTECEYQTVISFYHSKPATVSAHLHTGKITTINGTQIHLTYHWGGTTKEKMFSLSPGYSIYNQGSPVTVRDLRVGDNVVFVTQAPPVQEGVDPFAATDEVFSIFKTQYDTSQALSASKNGFYDENNIMPLDMYNQLRK
jgi:hypothetical protein